MEEKINMIEDLIQRCEECKFVACEQCEINWNDVQSIKMVLEAYKQDEEVIDEMAKMIACNTVPKNECNDCIKEYFRKKVETNE